MIRDVNQEPLAFCTRHCACKKNKIDDKERQSGAPLLFVCVGSLTMRAIEGEPLASIRNAYR
jgi:hypothetical protein